MEYSESLKKNREFQVVYRQGTSYANRYLVMYVMENHLERNRIGISVSKKVGNSVVRHRLTRLIRESYRLNEQKFRKGMDLVVVARVNAKGRSFREIEKALLHLGKLHKVLNRRPQSVSCLDDAAGASEGGIKINEKKQHKKYPYQRGDSKGTE